MHKNVSSIKRRFITMDLKRGIKTNIVKYVIFSALLVACITVFGRMVNSNFLEGKIYNSPGYLDILVYLFTGNEAFNIANNNIFVMQPAWLVMCITPAFLVYSYAVSDLEGLGLQFLIKGGNRVIWWKSKCIWSVASILILYMITYGIILIQSIIFGNTNALFTVHDDICQVVTGVTIQPYTKIIILLFLVPVIESIGISLLQMALSLILNPMLGFIIVLVTYVSSAYFSFPLLPGGYMMVMRWTQTGINNGLNPELGIMIAIVIGAVGVLCGLVYVKNMDIIERNI